MNNKFLVSALLSATLLSSVVAPCFAQYNNNSQSNYSFSALKGHVVTIPMGTSISATAQNDISSETLTVGDSVMLSVGNNVYSNGVLAIPAGSSLQGNVVIAQKAGFNNKGAKLKIKFTSAITPSGQRIPLSGKISTPDGSGILVGGTTKGRVTSTVKNSAVGAGIGALVGTFMGPLSGGKVGRGAVYGTAVGGGLGLGKSLIDKGNQVTIPAGNSVDVILDQPATINLNQSNY